MKQLLPRLQLQRCLTVQETLTAFQCLADTKPESCQHVWEKTTTDGYNISLYRVGPLKAKYRVLLTGWIHPNEPLGGTALVALVNFMLAQSTEILQKFETAWFIIPAVEIGQALVNTWVEKPLPYTLKEYCLRSWIEPISQQADFAFPPPFDDATPASFLALAIRELRPHLYVPLHNDPFSDAAYIYTSLTSPEVLRRGRQALRAARVPMLNTLPYGDIVSSQRLARGWFTPLTPQDFSLLNGFNTGWTSYQYAASLGSHVMIPELPFFMPRPCPTVSIEQSHWNRVDSLLARLKNQVQSSRSGQSESVFLYWFNHCQPSLQANIDMRPCGLSGWLCFAQAVYYLLLLWGLWGRKQSNLPDTEYALDAGTSLLDETGIRVDVPVTKHVKALIAILLACVEDLGSSLD